jgi:hypothetical protein
MTNVSKSDFYISNKRNKWTVYEDNAIERMNRIIISNDFK